MSDVLLQDVREKPRESKFDAGTNGKRFLSGILSDNLQIIVLHLQVISEINFYDDL